MTGMDIVSRFGASVRNLRYRMGMSQEDLAERADLHRTYVAGIEGGARNVTLRVVAKLARALEVSAATLLSSTAEADGKEGNSHSRRDASRQFVDILLAEDNADDAELTLRAFKQARFANFVHVVRDGQEALDYLFCHKSYAGRRQADRPKLLLLDLNLPKVSGLEVLRRIKADRRTRMIPVVVLTSSKMDRDIAECRRLGAESYILKPVDFGRLSAVTPDLRLNWGLFRSHLPAAPNVRG
jgi:CheY-like chemotaxis protein/DNA-binding XRE family transcriptional regulator